MGRDTGCDLFDPTNWREEPMTNTYQDVVQAYLDAMDPPARMVGWPDAPAVQMADSGRFVNVPRAKVDDAFKRAIGEHLGQPLPEGTVVTGITQVPGGFAVNITNPEFGELPPGASHELKPRGVK